MLDQIEKSRKDLLDFTLRNKLISYKNSTRYTIEICEERSNDVFNILVVQSKSMTFQPIPEKNVKEDREEFSFIQPVEKVNNESRFTDTILETTHIDKQLQNRLRSIASLSKTSIEEQGVNVLYLALGFLKWYESAVSEIARYAPLVLVPIKLERTNVRSKFRIRYNEEDVGVNISLLEKLRAEYGIKLSIPSIEEANDVSSFYESVRKEIGGLDRWEVVENDIRLGFFSFAKFLMYHDLKAENWPEDQLPQEHPLLSKLLGNGFEGASSGANKEYGDDIKYEELYHVLPSDSSQQDVVFAIRNGVSMVVQGPPGTGKSQTITNIIADFVARGKKVLFVAEKMAALNVVKNRLDSLGIGDIALELHSHKSKKKEVLQNLQSTLALPSPNSPFIEHEVLSDAEQVRSIINKYALAVNTAVGETGYTPIQAFGYILQSIERIGEENLPKINIEGIKIQNKAQYLQKREVVRDVKLALERTGTKLDHPFNGIQAIEFDFYDSKIWLEVAEEYLLKVLVFDKQLSTALAEWPTFETTKCSSSLEKLINAVEILTEKPVEPAIDYHCERIDSIQKIDELFEVLQSIYSLQKRFKSWEGHCFDQTWEQNALALRVPILEYGSKWYRKLFSSYRNAINTVKSWVKDQNFKEEEALCLIDLILAHQEAKKAWNATKSSFEKIFGFCDSFIDVPESWAGSLTWAKKLHVLINDDTFYNPLYDLKDVNDSSLNQLKEVLDTYKKVQAEGKSHLEKAKYDGGFKINAETTIESIIQVYGNWVQHKEKLQDFIQLLKNINRFGKEGLDWLLHYVEEWDLAPSHLEDIFNYIWFTIVARQAFKEHDILHRFEGENHHHTVKKFMELEDQILELNAYRLVTQHYNGLPNHGGVSVGKLGLLNAEFAKKRKQLPIRKLLEQCGQVIQDIKPVFMMSPMSIAQYLPQGGIDFDLVLFDEASQIKPVEAFGAVLRAKQVVVVGDSKQLPPTSFFDSIIEDGFEEEEEGFETVQTGDVESILTLFSAKQAQEKMLRWHYRSKHESLITVNNYEFYNSGLLVFPTAYQEDPKRGLHLTHLPNTVYEPGKGGRKNRGEAQEVINQIIQHAKNYPELSLGVAAFSQTQARLIEDVLEKTLLENNYPEVEQFINSKHVDEPFFIKNLENVQGDERDVIFISVGYGKQQNGKLSMNFGPINKEGGERRLNVLFSRAKQQCMVYSNLKADDIDLSRTSSVGVNALKKFLQYAQNRELSVPEVGNGFAESPFEQQVADTLIKNGYDIAHQVGTAGFRIDIGVKHPKYKGRFILAVECDGASYHSSQIARDRDKTRQLVLEAQGWVFHRIWSTDWFHNQKRESERLLATVEHYSKLESTDLKSKPKNIQSFKKEDGIKRREVETTVQSTPKMISQPYQISSLRLHLNDDLHEYAPSQFADWIGQIVQDEQPVHHEIVLYRIVKAAGLSKTGRRIRVSFEQGLSHAIRNSYAKKDQDFLYVNPDKVEIRDRSHLERIDRKIEHLPYLEVQKAIFDVLEKSYGSTEEDLLQAVPEYFGISRRTEDVNDLIKKTLAQLQSKKMIQLNEQIYIMK